jgi:hypothetical protein
LEYEKNPLPKAPPVNPTPYNAGWRASGTITDNHTVPLAAIGGAARVYQVNQVYLYEDMRSGSKDIPVQNSGYTIVKDIEQEKGLWNCLLTKKGIGVDVKVAQDGQQVTYSSGAGMTTPATGIMDKITR